MSVKFISHKDEVDRAMERAITAALEAIGSQCAGYAIELAPHDTGRLRNSITWATDKSDGRDYNYSDDHGKNYSYKIGSGVPSDAVYIGTNVEYAVYQELGTSKMSAQPFLKPAVVNHKAEYKKMAESFLRGKSQ